MAMKERDEIIIRHDTKPKPRWPCPKCHGVGDMQDGSFSQSATETRIRRPTKCGVCKGSGRVNVTPIE